MEYNANVIEDIYNKDLNTASESNVRKVMMLEFSQYLENYLWLNFNPDASPAHVMSIGKSKIEFKISPLDGDNL